MQLRISGKKAVITGGSRGIALAIAKALAKEGASVVICARNAQVLAEVTKAIEKEGGQCFSFSLDLANAATIQNGINSIAQKLGGIDILVNSGARVSGPTPEDFWHVSEDLMQEDFTVKVLGYLRVSRAVAPYMQQNHWGGIIHLSGLAARFAGNISAGFRNAAVVTLPKAWRIPWDLMALPPMRYCPLWWLQSLSTSALQHRLAIWDYRQRHYWKAISGKRPFAA